MLSLFVATPSLVLPSARAPLASTQCASPRAGVAMFEQSSSDEYVLPRPAITTAEGLSASAGRTGGALIVTEGSDNWFGSRSLIQSLFSFGDAKSITVHGASVAAAKKALISRSSRYSGLLDVLDYSEGAEWGASDAWLAINADEAALPAQIAAAKAAGVKRAFLLLTESGPTSCPSDGEAMEAMLGESGMAYTVMRTGELVADDPPGGGLRLGELDLALRGRGVVRQHARAVQARVVALRPDHREREPFVRARAAARAAAARRRRRRRRRAARRARARAAAAAAARRRARRGGARVVARRGVEREREPPALGLGLGGRDRARLALAREQVPVELGRDQPQLDAEARVAADLREQREESRGGRLARVRCETGRRSFRALWRGRGGWCRLVLGSLVAVCLHSSGHERVGEPASRRLEVGRLRGRRTGGVATQGRVKNGWLHWNALPLAFYRSPVKSNLLHSVELKAHARRC